MCENCNECVGNEERKKLSMDVVKTVTDFMLVADGLITSLGLKEMLRDMGFEATQKEVSERLEAYMECFFPYEIDDVSFTVDFEYAKDDDDDSAFKIYYLTPYEGKPLIKPAE